MNNSYNQSVIIFIVFNRNAVDEMDKVLHVLFFSSIFGQGTFVLQYSCYMHGGNSQNGNCIHIDLENSVLIECFNRNSLSTRQNNGQTFSLFAVRYSSKASSQYSVFAPAITSLETTGVCDRKESVKVILSLFV